MRISAWSKFLAPLAVFALAACGGEAPVEAPEGSEPTQNISEESLVPVMGPERNIVAFGDSLFAGYGVGLENSYPTKLEAAMRARGINVVMANAAVSGDTSAAGAQRLAFILDAQEQKPDLFILELGGNDMLRQITPEQTRANFVSMLDELQSREIPVLMMGMRAPPNLGPEYQSEFDGLYGELAQQYGATLIPFWLESIYEDPSLFQDDRIHPTVEGLEALVAATLDQVIAALPEAEAE